MLPLLAATILSTSLSNSSTGENTVQGGDVVTGSSYSSVSVQTYDNGSGGTSTVEIDTDTNGQASKQVITKVIPPGGSSDTYIATSSGPSAQAGDSRVEVDSDIGAGSSTTPESAHEGGVTTTVSSSVSIPSFTQITAPDFGSFWRHFFGFFRLWW